MQVNTESKQSICLFLNFHSFILYSFNQSLLSKYYILGTVLDTGGIALNEMDKIPVFCSMHSSNRHRQWANCDKQKEKQYKVKQYTDREEDRRAILAKVVRVDLCEKWYLSRHMKEAKGTWITQESPKCNEETNLRKSRIEEQQVQRPYGWDRFGIWWGRPKKARVAVLE